MSIRLVLVSCLVLLIGAACGGGSDPRPTPTPSSQGETTTPSPGGTPPPATITTLRVAYLNLMSPLEEGEGSVAWMTYGDRINVAIADLSEFDADLIGVSEATWVKALEQDTWSRLVSGLKLEGSILARANPWSWNTSKEESDAAVQREGYEEGEYLLSRYPIVSSKRYPLNAARVSVAEGRAVLHAVVKLPEPVGEVDVYVTRFAGEERIREAQAFELYTIISNTRDQSRGLVVMGDLGSDPDSAVLDTLLDAPLDLVDAMEGSRVYTCCRASVLGDEEAIATATAVGSETPENGDPDETAEDDASEPETISARHDFILVSQWSVESSRLIGNEPRATEQGEMLYASDHNGIGIEFFVDEPEQ